MTVEEIRAAAERRVAQMKPEEYERYAAQARADLELTETKLFYTLKGEERNRFLRARERLTERDIGIRKPCRCASCGIGTGIFRKTRSTAGSRA